MAIVTRIAEVRDPFVNTFDLAAKIGYETYGEIGQHAYEELELCFASKLAPQNFSEVNMRAFINLNFYWNKSYFKNTILEEFDTCLPEGFTRRKITGGTTETIFGGINQNGSKISTPLFWGSNIAYIPELSSFLSTKEYKDKVNILNEVLEGKQVTRDLLKFSNASQDLIDAHSAGVDGLFFDGRTLKYTPNTAFVVCSRPIENERFTYLDSSGFWSRFHTLQFRITDSSARDIFTGSFAPSAPNIDELKAKLKLCNESLFTHRNEIHTLLPAYKEILLPTLTEASSILEQKCKLMSIEYNDTVTTRLKGDIAREAKAYQILCPERSNEEVKKWLLTRLQHFFDFVVNPLIAKDFTAIKATRADVCMAQILQYIKNTERTWKEINDEMERQGHKPATISRVLKFMKEKGMISTTAEGLYKS